jgi:hypothetical protein
VMANATFLVVGLLAGWLLRAWLGGDFGEV